MAQLTPRQKLAAARLWACRKMPYFTVALHSLVVCEWDAEAAVGFPTMAVTEDAKLLVDYRFIEEHTVEQIGSVLIHELQHVLREHHKLGRQQGIYATSPKWSQMIWNWAIDAAINDDLVAGGLPLPSDGGVIAGKAEYLLEHAETGWMELEYYQHILAQLPNPMPEGDEPEAPEGWAPCGSAAGAPVPGEPEKEGEQELGGEGDNQSKGQGQTVSMPGRSEAELEGIRKQTAAQIQQHEASRGAGSVPGGLSRWAKQKLEPPKLDWRQQLQRAVRYAIAYRPGAVDYTYDRPSRRQGGFGWGLGQPILPAMYMPLPRVGLGVDTSGSMGTKELWAALCEGQGILEAAGADVDYIVCDAKVSGVGKVASIEELQDALKGGGGTDFRPVFTALAEMERPPEVFVFITDGMGPAPTLPPNIECQFIFLLVGPYKRIPWAADPGTPGYTPGKNITWGEHVFIPDAVEAGAA